MRSNLASARVVLGHTRWSTQGATTLDNASPLNAGDIIGHPQRRRHRTGDPDGEHGALGAVTVHTPYPM